MLKNKDIICISSIDWNFIWQGHQEIMSTLAKNGNRVLFIENTGVRVPGIRDFSRVKSRIKNWFLGVRGIREEGRNLYIFSPIVLPFPYLKIANWLNQRLILSVLEKWFKVMKFRSEVAWVFLPTPLTLRLTDKLNSQVLIYYCIDNFRASSSAAKKIKKSETKLLKRSDLVFTTSGELYNYCSAYNNNVYFFPFAVNFREFEKVRMEKGAFVEELKGLKRPLIGYVGGIHKWIDLRLIKEAAEKYPQYSFVFVGPIQTDISMLSNLKNIYFLGKRHHNQIPYFIKSFDLCIIPYLIADYTRNVYPTKLNEYLAMGKPVLSTQLEEIKNFNKENNNLILTARNRQDFINCISRALERFPQELFYKSIAVAQKNSWAGRIEEMSNLIGAAVDRKASASLNWQEGFAKLFKSAQRKAIGVAAVFLAAYLLLFYTPLIWFLAAPLKMPASLKKADCIVVLAGGVGESGRAGQGYEERVQYAVELYNRNYARQLIFSSGYMYVFKEPLVMKALAVSLGVRGENIILEEKARNTYENAAFTAAILKEKGWDEIILVSSPYHMRRVGLVFDKVGRGIELSYAPLPDSLFFSHKERDARGRRIWRRANFRQIRAILKEYLAILYYWRKGYIDK